MDLFNINKSDETTDSEIDKKQISIKEIVAIVKIYGIEVLKFSWLMIIVGCLLGYYMKERKMKTPTTYTAYASFQMDETSTAEQQNIASIFGGSGIVGGGKTTLKSLKELIKTRMIIHKALFHKVALKHEENPREDFLINHFLRKFSYENSDSDKNFYFKSDTIDPYNRKKNRLIKSIHGTVANSFIKVDITPTGTVNMQCFSKDEDFSYELIMALYNQLDSFYSKSKLKQKEGFYKMAEARTKDLDKKLKGAEAAYITHMNSNAAEAVGRYNTAIKTQYLSTDLRSATEAYFSALRSREAAWIAFEKQKQSPVLQMIDQPLYPLRANVPNPFLHMVLGFVAGFGLIFLLVIARKFIKDYLGKQKEMALEQKAVEEEEIAHS